MDLISFSFLLRLATNKKLIQKASQGEQHQKNDRVLRIIDT